MVVKLYHYGLSYNVSYLGERSRLKGILQMGITERGIETKLKLLQAAINEFSEKGFHGARVDAIADAAGVNKQRVYAYFQSKENLFAEVLKHCFELITQEEESFRNLTDQDIPGMGETILRRYMDFHERYPYFWRLIAWENLDGGKHSYRLKDVRRKTFAHLKHLYETGQEKGLFKSGVSFESFIFALSAHSFFYFANQHTMSETLDLDLFNPEIRERILAENLELMSLSKARDIGE